MRGSHRGDTETTAHHGIIPAHAGLTQSSRATIGQGWDHPRACGAHRTVKTSSRNPRGSSPRMRGSHGVIGGINSISGIIPAHAGLTGAITPIQPEARDHPRACGAHGAWHSEQQEPRGSSPRMRGSRNFHKCQADILGIIPAHAGLTTFLFCVLDKIRDHPRACGAHSRRATTIRWRSGSSPRMRGSLDMEYLNLVGVGIIPAHAGLTLRGCSLVQ